MGQVTFTASIEDNPASRTTVDTYGGQGIINWATGDAISVLNTNNDFDTFTLSSGANTSKASFVGTFAEGTDAGSIAIYPAGNHSYDGTTLTVDLPTSYGNTNTPYTPNANVLMIAHRSEEDGKELYFKHLGGVLFFNVEVPAGATSVSLIAKNKSICRKFDVVESGSDYVINEARNQNINYPLATNTVTHYFKAFDTKRTETFYFPVPTGEYKDFVITVGGNEGLAIEAITFNTAQSLSRTTIARLKSISGLALQQEYVDLGLPSGTLWAKYNVGAVTEVDYGKYYAWGEIAPKTQFSWTTYKLNIAKVQRPH